MVKTLCRNAAFILRLYNVTNYDLKGDAWSVANAVRHILSAADYRSKDANVLMFFINCFFNGSENKHLRDPEIEHAFRWLLHTYEEGK